MMNIIEISKTGFKEFSVIVSDGQEVNRFGQQEHENFLDQAENFLQERYGEYASPTYKELITLEYNGSAFFTLKVKTEGIVEDIANEWGLSIHQAQN